MKLIILLNILLSGFELISQNLVLNPSFEKVKGCPPRITAFYLYGVENWYQTTAGSVDYFSICNKSGTSKEVSPLASPNPIEGKAYIGFYYKKKLLNTYGEYFTGALSEKLISGKTYWIEFWYYLDNENNLSPKDVGIYFSSGKIYVERLRRLKYTAHIATSHPESEKGRWVKYNFIYKALGGETHLTLGWFGKFKDCLKNPKGEGTTSVGTYLYFYLDNITITPIPEAYISVADTVVAEDENLTDFIPINTGDTLRFSDIHFKTGVAALEPSSVAVLDSIYELLMEHPFLVIEIGGHTDSVGAEKTNQYLSEKRAEAVKNYLIKKGISENRLSHVGHAANYPVADNQTEEGKALNRRVELVVKDNIDLELLRSTLK